MDESDFAVEASVGAGSFGEVFRVRKVTGPDCGRRYAMKKIAGRRQEAQERRMLLAAEHPFVVRLRYAFATTDGASCLVMDFASRGTLEGHLNKRAGRRLDVGSAPGQEKRAKFPTSKAPISAVFHSFRLIFGRAIISRNGLEAWMLFPERARAEHSC